jgi:hypothetical protein
MCDELIVSYIYLTWQGGFRIELLTDNDKYSQKIFPTGDEEYTGADDTT